MDYELLEFPTQAALRTWYLENAATCPGIWLKVYKKHSGIQTVTINEALDQALCFGWIDGQRKSFDEHAYLQKYTPRRPRSLWSKRNIEHVTRLTEAGLITPAGQEQIDKAKADGRWAAAYDAQSTMETPDYFLKELSRHPKAEAFFSTLNRSNKFAIIWRLQTAKTEATRNKRIEQFITMLEAGKKLQ
jgi:uncharacterized protein YdeI (YjbR/CyaY-like superfamily)